MKKIIILLVFVLIIKITQAQNGNVGIGTNNPLTKLDIVGAISTQSGTPVAVSGNTAITVGNSSFIKITTSVAIPANAKVSLSNGLEDGQILTLYVAADSLKGVEMNNAANLRLTKTPLNLMGRSASYFIWDASNNLWIELGHVPTLPTKQVFAHTGSQQIFTVPVGITSIKVKMWGAGGGAGYSASTSNGTSGGSGGYVEGVLTVTPLQNIVVVVGDGGSTSTIGETPLGFIAGLGGGAAGGTCNSLGAVGIGGGASYITSMSGTVYAVAGGGGGGGGSPNAAGTQSFGGAGGGATGGNGGNGNAGSSGGKGGTASAGGAGGTGLTNNGLAGSAFYGGNGGNSSWTTTYGGGGGGGGGYYGGGGGAGGTSTAGNSGGGGGGSSYVNPTYFSVTSNLQGSSGSGGGIKTAPNNTDLDYISGTGEAGYVGTYIYSAGDGLIVFFW